jgi:O-antigen/teichoic acid export membrane protein
MNKIRSKIKSILDGETQTLFKNSAWVFVSNSYGILLAFLRSIVIARGLGAEILGIYSVIIAFVLTILYFRVIRFCLWLKTSHFCGMFFALLF